MAEELTKKAAIHRDTLLRHLMSTPTQDWPSRVGYADVLGISFQSMYDQLKAAGLNEIENTALQQKREMFAPELAKIDIALIAKALDGDVPAIKLAKQFFEGWSEKQQVEVSTDEGLAQALLEARKRAKG